MKIKFQKLFTINLKYINVFLILGADKSVQERTIKYLKQKIGKIHIFTEKEFLQETFCLKQNLFENKKHINMIKDASIKSFNKFKSIKYKNKSCYMFLTSNLKISSTFSTNITNYYYGLVICCYPTYLLKEEVQYYMKKFFLKENIISYIHNKFIKNPNEFFNFLQIYQILHDTKDNKEYLHSSFDKKIQHDKEKFFLLQLTNQNQDEIPFPTPPNEKISTIRLVLKILQDIYKIKIIKYNKEKNNLQSFLKYKEIYNIAANKIKFKEIIKKINRLLYLEKQVKIKNPYIFEYEMIKICKDSDNKKFF